jgi:hypothetical protein
VVALEPLDRWPALRAWGADVDAAAVARGAAHAAGAGARGAGAVRGTRAVRPAAAGVAPPPRARRGGVQPAVRPRAPDVPNALVAGRGSRRRAPPAPRPGPRARAPACRAWRCRGARSATPWGWRARPRGAATCWRRCGRRRWPTASTTGSALAYYRTLPTAFLDESGRDPPRARPRRRGAVRLPAAGGELRACGRRRAGARRRAAGVAVVAGLRAARAAGAGGAQRSAAEPPTSRRPCIRTSATAGTSWRYASRRTGSEKSMRQDYRIEQD